MRYFHLTIVDDHTPKCLKFIEGLHYFAIIQHLTISLIKSIEIRATTLHIIYETEKQIVTVSQPPFKRKYDKQTLQKWLAHLYSSNVSSDVMFILPTDKAAHCPLMKNLCYLKLSILKQFTQNDLNNY